ncbi:MAG: hypothetical protein LUE94_19015 [Clostridiales bacterium]|nr:hypothetical protein [Clostridiales bacterium]
MLSEEKSRQIEMAGTDRACMMLVCINGHENNVPYGIIVNYHLPRPVNFKGIHGMVLALDEVCEMVGAPMATTEPRFLQKEREHHYRALMGKQKKKPGKILAKEDGAGKMCPYVTAAKAVILVHVLYRQNSSMQGRLQCSCTGTHYIAFRSALELMRMLDEANTYMCRNRKNKDLKM